MRQSIAKLDLQAALGAAVVALVVAGGLACQRDDNNQDAHPNAPVLSVVTSIHPMEYFVRRVGGDLVEVTNLLPPGMEAHGYEPSAGDLRRLETAGLVVMNGLELEPWLERSLRALGDRAPSLVIEAADVVRTHALPVDGHGHDDDHEDEHDDHNHDGDEGDHGDDHGHEHGEFDPHVWLDPLLASAQVEGIRDALMELAPEHAQSFRANAQDLADDLRGLHERFESTLASCVHDHFVTTHAAYAYLAARYGLRQVSITGLTPEAEPSPQRLAQISDQVRELGLGYILVEPILGTRLADTVRRETGVELLPIHQIESVTLAELSEHGDYMGLMENNLRSLSIALECGT